MGGMEVATREIDDGVFWLHETHTYDFFTEQYLESRPDWYDPGRDVRTIVNAFLLTGERTLLFDTLSPAASDEVLEALADALDGDDLDYVVPSHPEPPHAGNTGVITDAHPEATVLVPAHSSKHDLYHLDDARVVDPGDTLALGKRTVEFVDPPFFDHSMTHWLFERTSRTLFTVDWFSFNCMDGEQLQFVDELETPVTPARLREMNEPIFFWLQYADVEKTTRAIDRLRDRFDPDALAPAHGLVARADVDTHLESMAEMTRRAASGGTQERLI